MGVELAVYFTDDEGQCWRVYDVAFGPPLAASGKSVPLSFNDPRARYRLFVPPDRGAMLRSYRLEGVADRQLDTETVARQFRAASYSPRATRREAEPPAPYLGG